MPIIPGRTSSEIISYIDKNQLVGSSFVLLSPLPQSVEQHGQTCKLYALSMAMNWAFMNSDGLSIPPVARKRDNRSYQISLRSMAKRYGSKQGEVYDYRTLIELAKTCGFDESYIITETNEKYVQAVCKEVDAKNTPILFFDINKQTLEAHNNNSKHEHAAVVIGYYTDKTNRIRFIIMQYGNYYSLDALLIAESANQLQEIREPETFAKDLNKLWKQVDNADAKQFEKIVTATRPTDAKGTLRNKILIINSKSNLKRKQNLSKTSAPTEPMEITPAPIFVVDNPSHTTNVRDTFKRTGFFPLDEFINFIEIDLIRPTPYDDKKLESLLNEWSFIDELYELTQTTYHTVVEQTLEDDIYKQNPNRTRSLTELTSNAIDANASSIRVEIKDGEYEIDDNGFGMAAKVIMRKLNLTKATTKEDSVSDIGRFGLGFYTALAHLNHPDDQVVVETKAVNNPAYRIVYKKIAAKIHIKVSTFESKKIGTKITVKSNDIRKETYETSLYKNILYHLTTPIFINGKLANNVSPSEVIAVSASKIIIRTGTTKKSTLTIGGNTIYSFIPKPHSSTLEVAWDLPKQTTISESRNQARIDSDALRLEIKKLIDFGVQLPTIVQAPYYNSITPLVVNLQTYNSSQHKHDNLLVYLQDVVNKLYSAQKQLPDLHHLENLIVPGVTVLDPLLVNPNWKDTIGYIAPHIQSNHVKFIIVNMKPHSGSIGFLHDTDEKTMYYDEADYRQIVNSIDYWKFELIFGLPPSGNNVYRKSDIQEMKTDNKEVVYSQQLTHRRYNALYQQHGSLATFGDDFFDQLTAQQLATLTHARTTMRTYPVHILIKEFQVTLCSYRYQGKHYYYTTSNYNRGTSLLLDEYFHPLFSIRDLYLLEKIEQLHQKKIYNVEIILDENEYFPIYDNKTRCSQIYDCHGNLVTQDKFKDTVRIEMLKNGYFLVNQYESKDKACLYHKSKGLIRQFSQRVYLSNTKPLQLASDPYYDENQFVYDVEKNKIIIGERSTLKLEGEISFSNGYYIGYHENESQYTPTFATFKPISIYDAEGNFICKYKNIKPSYDCKLLSTECNEDAASIYVSILYDNSVTQYLRIDKKRKTAEVLADDICIGFPCIAYIDPAKMILHFIDRSHKPIKLREYKTFVTDTETSKISNSSFCDRKGRYKTVKETIKDKVILLLNKDRQVLLIDNTGLHVILPKEIDYAEVSEATTSHDKYHVKLKNGMSYIVDRNGIIVVKGKSIQHKFNDKFDFYLIDNRYVVNHSGLIIFERPTIESISIHTNDDFLIVRYPTLEKDKREKDDLINSQGKLLLDEKSYHICFARHYLELYSKGSVHHLVTSKAIIYNAMTEICHSDIYQSFSLPEYKHQLYNEYGDPLYPTSLQSQSRHHPGDLIHDYRDEKKQNRILAPLTRELLTDSLTYENLAFLNKQNLTIPQYSYAIRFVHLEHEHFKIVFRHASKLTYVPSKQQGKHYADFCTSIERESEENQQQLIDLLNIVYDIAGTKNQTDMATLVIGIYEVYGLTYFKKLHETLIANQKKLQATNLPPSSQRDLINELPQDISQFIYFLFFPQSELLATKDDMTLPFKDDKCDFTLLDFYTAQRLDHDIVKFCRDKNAFLHLLNKTIANTHQHHLARKITHAIYHQAHPELALYIREFLQNAMDACAAEEKIGQVSIPIFVFKNKNQECVLSLEDSGIGMTEEEVLTFLMIVGNSTKRNSKGQFIGGRGVGFFTALHGAKYILLKTSKGDSRTHYFMITPVYRQKTNGEYEVVNAQVKWETVTENFKGSIFQRITTPKNIALQAAIYQRAIVKHGRFINLNEFNISVNGNVINKELIPLASTAIKNFGHVTLYKSHENALTGGGLYIKDLADELFDDVPTFVTKSLFKHGLLVNFPKSVALNRERSDFESVEEFNAFIKPYITQACYAAYISLFAKNIATLEELPYDFYDRFFVNMEEMLHRNPNVVTDAELINNGDTLASYDRYQDKQLLTDLLCHLNFIPLKAIAGYQSKLISLVTLAKLYFAYQLSSEAKAELPDQIKNLMSFRETQQLNTQRYYTEIVKYPDIDKISFIPNTFDGFPNWQLFIELSKLILQYLNVYPLQIGFSTISPNALAETPVFKQEIYWNPIAATKSFTSLLNLLESNKPLNRYDFQQNLANMIKVLSHEVVHANEGLCTGTHNNAFYLRQRTVLLNSLLKFNTEEIYQKYLDFFEKNIKGKPCPDAKDYMRAEVMKRNQIRANDKMNLGN